MAQLAQVIPVTAKSMRADVDRKADFFDLPDQIRRRHGLGIEGHRSLFGGKIDVGIVDTGQFFKAPGDVHGAVGASHARDRKNDGPGCHGRAG
jgi:hypothetical protein